MKSLLHVSRCFILLIVLQGSAYGTTTVHGVVEHHLGQGFTRPPTSQTGRIFEHNSLESNIRIKLIRASGEEALHAYADDRLAMYRSVFESKRVDYPGQYSKVIECPEKYQPKFMVIDNEDFLAKVFLGYANKNKVSGACVADLISYRHIYGFVYCKSKVTLYEVDHFSATDSNASDRFINSLTCQP
jgi:hypothetical protein